jgi:superfamily I DNA and/or RNA helicase
MGYRKHLLDVQYRMHPHINDFPNKKFYSARISDGANVRHESYCRSYIKDRMYGAYSFIDIENDNETSDSLGQSWKNMVEVAAVHHIVKCLAEGKVEYVPKRFLICSFCLFAILMG